ncbi:MAG TPA: hypothetical protein GX707_14985 [Epulopiscium sp.]|nr:hypothetical protein [Candidatus Epulonipiscium sp.]
MSRKKKQWIQKLTTKDTKMLAAFANVGYLNKSMLKNELAMAERRIKNFKKDNLIEKKDYYNKKTHNMEQAYRLTNKGKKLIQEELGTKYFYKSNSPQHDLALGKRYFEESEENRSNWITENEWRDNFQKAVENLKVADPDKWEEVTNKWNSGEISPPDGGYKSATGTVAIEVVTANYEPADRESKIEFANTLNIDLQIERG